MTSSFFSLLFTIKIQWLTRQGYPAEVIDEIIAEQDRYEEEGYYDEVTGEWISTAAEVPAEEQVPPAPVPMEEEKVPSPPAAAAPAAPVAAPPAAQAKTAQDKAAQEAIDKDLKAAQDAAKAAGDAAKNLIGGIGGSLFGGGGKKSGGFGLGGFMGGGAQPKKQEKKPQPKKAEPAKAAPKPKEPEKPAPTPVKKEGDQPPPAQAGQELLDMDNEEEEVPDFDEPMKEESVPEPAKKDSPKAEEKQPGTSPEKPVETDPEKKLDEDEKKPLEKTVSFAPDGKPKFVKHINKTRTMSGRQKWDWAFEKIIQVSLSFKNPSPRTLLEFSRTHKNCNETADQQRNILRSFEDHIQEKVKVSSALIVLSFNTRS